MRTLANSATVELEIRRSRFVAHAARVDNLAETLSFYETVTDASATHNCWAWRLDHRYRFNDDGEPASTAGKPILAAIDGKNLNNTMIVVTRYFGGTKLGVGGLIRAYSGSAAKCIDRAGIAEINPVLVCTVQAGFAWTGQVYSVLETCAAAKLGENFNNEGVEIRIEIAEASFEKLKSMLRDATRGEVRVRPGV